MTPKKILLPVLISIFAVGVLTLSVSRVHAATNTTPFSGLIQKLATKFNLKTADVQSVFDEYKNEEDQSRTTMMQQREETYLTGLVSQGKITADQKTAIIAEIAALKAKNSPSTYRSDFEAWLKTQNIDSSLIQLGFGMGRGMMDRGGLHERFENQ